MSFELLTWKDENGNVSSLFVDIVGDFDSLRTAELTRFAIENGSKINDHVSHEPPKVTAQIRQVSKPISDDSWINTRVQLNPQEVATNVVSPFLLAGRAIRSVLFSASNNNAATVKQKANPGNRQQDLYETLIKIIEGTFLCSVTYDNHTYDNVLLTSLKKQRTSQAKGVAVFDVAFETPVIVLTKGAVLPKPKKLTAKPAASQGAKGTATPKKSLLKKALDDALG